VSLHIAMGYRHFATAAGYHLERAFRALGHRVPYVGLGVPEQPGYAETTPIDRIVAQLPEPPDLYLWIDPAGRYFPPGIEQLPIPTACYLIDVHLGTWRHQVAQFFDVVFVAQKDYVTSFRRTVGHHQVYWLPLAAARDVHRRLELARVYDVGFVGNIAAGHRRTPRARRLKLVAERYRTNDFFRFYPPKEVGQIYSQSRIVFNTSIAGDVTMRIFEGTACGALVVTDSVANGLDELFEVGQEIVTYGDDTELLKTIDYYLAHDKERYAIAEAGYRRTLAEHTYQHRVQAILDIINRPNLEHWAPMRTAPPSARYAARRKVYTHLHMLDAILDQARQNGYNPAKRLWLALPCLARRILG